MKITGEVVKFSDEWYQYIDGNKCENCDLKEYCMKSEPVRICGKNNYVIFRKLNKVEENLKFYEGLSFDKYSLAYYGIMDPIYNGNEVLFFTESFMYVMNKTQKEMKIKKIKIDHKDADYLLDVLERILHDNHCTEYKDEIIKSFGRYFDYLPEYVPFDLNKVLNGADVCTRGGKKARIICSNATGKFPIIALITEDNGDEVPYKYHPNGNYNLSGSSEFDLVMIQSIRSGWMNIYKTDDSDFAAITDYAYLFKTEEEAERKADHDTVLATVEVKWKE